MSGPLAQQFAQVRSDIAECCHDCGDGCQRDKTVAALSAIERHVQDMASALGAARVVADMHESGEGFQWVGSEDDTEALDALCRSLAALPAREKGEE